MHNITIALNHIESVLLFLHSVIEKYWSLLWHGWEDMLIHFISKTSMVPEMIKETMPTWLGTLPYSDTCFHFMWWRQMHTACHQSREVILLKKVPCLHGCVFAADAPICVLTDTCSMFKKVEQILILMLEGQSKTLAVREEHYLHYKTAFKCRWKL